MVYSCSKCDAQSSKWSGRCMECGSWGTLKETESPRPAPASAAFKTSARPARAIPLADLAAGALSRIASNEFPAAKMFPSGVVRGSTILLTGEPGSGKSTLCLQLAANYSAGAKVLYVSSEESAAQVKERAARIGLAAANFSVAESTSLDEVAATVIAEKPAIVCVDSLQTLASSAAEREAGSPAQVRIAAATLAELSHSQQCCIILVGHVTKDGSIAGPKALEHLVDAVYVLEADRKSTYRLLRSYKNRYGETGSVVVLQLGSRGLTEVANASTIFIQHYAAKPGSVITIAEIDDQLFFVEVQALVSKTGFGYAKRTASGFSRSRLELLLAVMKKHLHVDTDGYDIYINIAGGFHVGEPALDSAVILATLSSLKEVILPDKTVVFGEVGLSGELRAVRDTAARLKETERRGFKKVFMPHVQRAIASKTEVKQFSNIRDVVASLGW